MDSEENARDCGVCLATSPGADLQQRGPRCTSRGAAALGCALRGERPFSPQARHSAISELLVLEAALRSSKSSRSPPQQSACLEDV